MTVYFSPAKYQTEIVGEAKTQKAIREIIMYKIMVEKYHFEYKDENLTATLVLEDNNKYDLGNAVRVDINQTPVGYLKKEDAQKYRKSLSALNLTNEICTCNASAFGKRPEMGKMMYFGIWLAIDVSNLEPTEPPAKRKKLFGIF